MSHTVVLAGAYHTFEWFCKKVLRKSPFDRTVIYADPLRLRGLRLGPEDHIVELGDFWRRPARDIDAIRWGLLGAQAGLGDDEKPHYTYVEDF